ncbi:hypothetical protein PIIN_10197 [Serendipita indica DSM 11827]|uniref:Uncharacterized protein n=1 Tax=Serendipita indica (strain DSM 11827) TaxID=1109443 RepID=G4TY11_SERID|nr:hypothetical protein PIIN_10197 [Serendipita indica DSM 11827]
MENVGNMGSPSNPGLLRCPICYKEFQSGRGHTRHFNRCEEKQREREKLAEEWKRLLEQRKAGRKNIPAERVADVEG